MARRQRQAPGEGEEGMWPGAGSPEGMGPEHQAFMQMFAMLSQENQQLHGRHEVPEGQPGLRKELEQQTFGAPEWRHGQTPVGVDGLRITQESEVDMERRRLREMTPVQFERLQAMMGTTAPAPGKRGGRGQRERSRSLQQQGTGKELVKQERDQLPSTQSEGVSAFGSHEGGKMMDVMTELVNDLVADLGV